jgi:hypothetical protein
VQLYSTLIGSDDRAVIGCGVSGYRATWPCLPAHKSDDAHDRMTLATRVLRSTEPPRGLLPMVV